MNAEFIGLLAVYLLVLFAIAPFLGRYIRIVMSGERSALTRWGQPLERGLYKLAGVDPGAEMGWKAYATGVIALNAMGVVALYALQRLQGGLPLNRAVMSVLYPY